MHYYKLNKNGLSCKHETKCLNRQVNDRVAEPKYKNSSQQGKKNLGLFGKSKRYVQVGFENKWRDCKLTVEDCK